MDKQVSDSGGRWRRNAITAVTIAVASLAGFGAVYVMAGGADNARRPVKLAQVGGSTPVALPSGPGANPFSVGQMAAFVFKKASEELPDHPFQDVDGKERSLKEWRGKVVLLNLWATWCAPCRKEMPGLDRLQGELGSDQFQVVAVSADKTGIAGAKKFLDQIRVEKLGVYADPTVRIHAGLKAIGMPATLLIDRQGREIGRLVGPAEWDSAEAKALIKAAMAAK
ncbi:MAG: TlpA disulfide reductase family protein [Hyphomicrobiaceae bacterium]|nr:TlpA disulfide reductase family protein [Hyphomicrobiaceae bacterium]